MLKHVLMCIGVIALCFIPYRPAQAATFDVCTLAELTAAITTANSNSQPDIINFTCSTTLNFTAQLTIESDGGNGVTINANGHNVVFDGGGSVQLFVINNNASLTLNGLTLQNGNAFDGGAIYNFSNGTVIINDSTFINNTTSFGGAILSNGSLTINNSIFTGNSVLTNGGAINSPDGALTITNSTFTNNSSNGNGGAVAKASGTMTISNSTFTGNSSQTDGGAIRNSSATTTISNSAFTNNSALNFGGAIFNSSTVNITNSTFTGNSASEGGAIQNYNAVNITNSTFTVNSASEGGAIRNVGTLTINNSNFTGNSATIGGAIRNLNVVNSTDTHYENNTCTGTIGNLGGNTIINATGCPGDPPIALDVSALSCNGDNAVFTINAGDDNFNITGAGVGLPMDNVPLGVVTVTGPGTWTDVTITERRGDRESINLGGILCEDDTVVIIPPSQPVAPPTAPDPFALGCVVTSDVDLMNAVDNTYCRILMRNGGVVNYSGAVPDSLIGLGVKLAVDVYRLDGGQSVVDFGGYSRVCLSGQGRLFYLDARTSPRTIIELATESIGGATCGWIPAAGTLVLTD